MILFSNNTKSNLEIIIQTTNIEWWWLQSLESYEITYLTIKLIPFLINWATKEYFWSSFLTTKKKKKKKEGSSLRFTFSLSLSLCFAWPEEGYRSSLQPLYGSPLDKAIFVILHHQLNHITRNYVFYNYEYYYIVCLVLTDNWKVKVVAAFFIVYRLILNPTHHHTYYYIHLVNVICYQFLSFILLHTAFNIKHMIKSG